MYRILLGQHGQPSQALTGADGQGNSCQCLQGTPATLLGHGMA